MRPRLLLGAVSMLCTAGLLRAMAAERALEAETNVTTSTTTTPEDRNLPADPRPLTRQQRRYRPRQARKGRPVS